MRFLFSGSPIADTKANIGLLLLRVFAGLTMALAHGLSKIPPSEKFVSGVSDMAFPAPELFAWAAGLAEFAGGILLAAGLCTRPSALFVAVTMGVAGFVRHAEDPFKNKELAFLYLAVAALFTLTGAGRFGLDRMLAARAAPAAKAKPKKR